MQSSSTIESQLIKFDHFYVHLLTATAGTTTMTRPAQQVSRERTKIKLNLNLEISFPTLTELSFLLTVFSSIRATSEFEWLSNSLTHTLSLSVSISHTKTTYIVMGRGLQQNGNTGKRGGASLWETASKPNILKTGSQILVLIRTTGIHISSK